MQEHKQRSSALGSALPEAWLVPLVNLRLPFLRPLASLAEALGSWAKAEPQQEHAPLVAVQQSQVARSSVPVAGQHRLQRSSALHAVLQCHQARSSAHRVAKAKRPRLKIPRHPHHLKNRTPDPDHHAFVAATFRF